VLRIYPTLNQKTAIQLADDVMAWQPTRVDVIQTDNGPNCSPFYWHVSKSKIHDLGALAPSLLLSRARAAGACRRRPDRSPRACGA